MSMHNRKRWPVLLRSEGWQSGRSGDAGRPWAHLLPWAHQSTTMQLSQTAAFYERDVKPDRRDFPQLKTEGTTRPYTVRAHPLGRWPAKGRVITIAEVLPKEQGAWGPHQALQPGGPAHGRWAPKTSGFEDQRGLHMGKPEDYRK